MDKPIDFIMTLDMLLCSMEQEQAAITALCLLPRVDIKVILEVNRELAVYPDHQNLMVVMLVTLLVLMEII